MDAAMTTTPIGPGSREPPAAESYTPWLARHQSRGTGSLRETPGWRLGQRAELARNFSRIPASIGCAKVDGSTSPHQQPRRLPECAIRDPVMFETRSRIPGNRNVLFMDGPSSSSVTAKSSVTGETDAILDQRR